MKRNWNLYALMLGLLVVSVCGCSEDRPEGFPELYPTTVTITQDGEKLADATVTLFPEDTSLSRWTVGGVTDSNGKVTLNTYSQYEGAPAGSFKVIVTKTETEGDPIPETPGPNSSSEERAAYDRAIKTGSFQVFQVVAAEYRAAGTTPLTVEITSGGPNDFPLDIGAAIKEEDIQASATSGGVSDEEYVPMGGE